ncbi:MAG TPA: ABC transporter permease [Alphaproteobacteria bacterium]|nr:ABC transporter permease [Alphaproteobacteria bacterium]
MSLVARMRAALREYAGAALILLGLLVAWQLVCDWAGVPVWLLPSPLRIVAETWKLRAVLPEHILATLWAVLGGFFLALASGVPLAVAVVYSPLLRRVLYPPLLMLQSVPKVAIAPLLLIWVGYGLSSRMIVAATVAFFPILINTATGLEAADAELLDLTRSFDAGRLKVFWKVRLPWALPYLFSSLKVAITLAVIGAVVAEFVGADKGLGYLILTSAGNMQTALMFGALVLLSLLGMLCFYAVVWVEKLLCPWYLPSGEQKQAR